MTNIEACSFVAAKYMYITNSMWKHARRTHLSPNNLIYVTEGTLYIEVRGERYAVNKNEFLFLPQGEESIGYRPSTTNTGFYFVLFRTTDSVSLPTHFTVQTPESISELYAMLIKSAYLKNYPQQAVNSLMHCIFYEVNYQLGNNAEPEEKSLAAAIKKYTYDTVFRNTTVHEIAAHFGLSDDYINRVFSRSEHITLKAYMNSKRIKKIEELLISSNTPLKTIADKLGFSSAAALSKFYKYHTGKTISEYREKFLS